MNLIPTSCLTGFELRAWREQAGLSPSAAAEMLGVELFKLAAYESGRIPVPDYIDRLVRDNIQTMRRPHMRWC